MLVDIFGGGTIPTAGTAVTALASLLSLSFSPLCFKLLMLRTNRAFLGYGWGVLQVARGADPAWVGDERM